MNLWLNVAYTIDIFIISDNYNDKNGVKVWMNIVYSCDNFTIGKYRNIQLDEKRTTAPLKGKFKFRVTFSFMI